LERSWVLLLVVILVGVSLASASMAILVLYRAALAEEKEHLRVAAISTARMIEAVARFDAEHSADYADGGPRAATLSQIVGAHESVERYGATGEFVVGTIVGEEIEFLIPDESLDAGPIEPIPVASTNAEPMRRALAGQSGAMIGPDYRGVAVLAAYEPVEGLNLGIVAKVDMAEFRAPFVKTSLLVLAATVLLVVLASVAVLKITHRVAWKIRQHADELEIRNRIIRAFLVHRDEEMYDEVLEALLDAFASEHGVFGFIDDEGAFVVPSMTRHIWDHCQVPDKRLVFPREEWGNSIWPTAIRQQEILHSNEPSRRTPEGHIPVLRNISAPVIHRGVVVGLFQVGNKATDYDSKDLALAQTIVDMIAPSLAGRLATEREERRRKAAEQDLRQSRDELARLVAERTDALRQSKVRYRDLVENLGDVVFELTLQGEFGYVSPAVDKMLGRTHADLHGLPIADLIHPDDLDGAGEELRGALAGQPTSVDLRVRHGDGSYRWVTAATRRTTTGSGAQLVGTLKDITEQRAAEEQLADARRMEAVGRLAGGVAHDFNNLLTVINTYAGFTLEELDARHPARADLEEVLTAGRRASSLTKQLLAYSRRQILEPENLRLDSVINDMENMVRRLIREDIEVQIQTAADLWHVEVDRGQIEQLLLNLAINASDAMPLGGRLRIEAANADPATAEPAEPTANGSVTFRVSDTGTGIPEEMIGHIFEPFFTTKERGQGTGLGLATVYGIVRQNGGEIDVHSELGAGTTFEVTFPAAEPAEVVKPSRDRDEALTGTEAVLVVEDEEAILRLAARILRKQGYRVTTARSGAEAVRLCMDADGKIDLLLTDVVMPGLSGKQLAEGLSGRFDGLKVLYMSGYTDDALASHGVLRSDTWLINKPFSDISLGRKVREVLDSEASRAPLGSRSAQT